MEPIKYYNRYTHQLETETVYGEKWLRWTYHNPFGQLCLHTLVKRPLFSHFYGWRMNQKGSRSKVSDFIQKYDVNTNEFLERPESFRTFNEFFYRKLQPSARPIDKNENTIVFPADGRHLAIPDISKAEGFYLKGQHIHLEELVEDNTELSKRYQNGTLVLSRLCPVDYHRFHFPVTCFAHPPQPMSGPLFSVNPTALKKNLRYLFTNKRMMTVLKTKTYGQILMFEVGATCVGKIHTTFTPNQWVQKGQEKGYFAFGGSSTLLLFEPGKIKLSEDLLKYSAQGIEVYAHMGDVLGKLTD